MKIFGIGLSKTGTTSLAAALEVLGYRAVHFPRELSAIDDYDAATDSTVARAYKELDARYPGSRFILTLRNLDEWLESCRLHFATRAPEGSWRDQLVRDLYGVPSFDASAFREAYERHHREIVQHFEGRPDQLLIVDLCDPAGDRWGPLCEFLGHPVPEVPFPHDNRSPALRRARIAYRRLRQTTKRVLLSLFPGTARLFPER